MTLISQRTQRSRVAGIDLLVCPTSVKDVVSIRGMLPGGGAHAQGNPAVPLFAAQLLDKGTLRQDKFALAQKLEAVGALLTFGTGNQMVNITGRCLRENLSLVIELLAEQLREPAYSTKELDRAKVAMTDNLKRRKDEADSLATEAMGQAIYPEGHLNRPTSIEALIAAIPQITTEDLHAFWKRCYGPEHLTLIFVGDVPKDQIQSEIAQRFGGWTGGAAMIPTEPVQPTTITAKELRILLPQKSTVAVLIGQATRISRRSPDHLALRLGTQVLGTGFTGRLMNRVRVRDGLTYGIGAGLQGDLFADGDFRINTSFTPALLERGIDSTRQELDRWFQSGVTESEVALRQRSLAGGYLVGLSTTSGLADQIMQTVQGGHALSWLDDFPSRVDALTVDDVNGAIRRRLDPSKMTIVRAGTLPTA